MIKILLVEDDEALNNSVCYFLRKNGYNVTGCKNGAEAYDRFIESVYDLIISDIMMDDVDGYEFAESVRASNTEIPIIFMSARSDYISKEKGYVVGIDDYIVKPVDLDELLLRINAILRRANVATKKNLVIGNFIMNSEAYSASCDGEDLGLSVREFHLLFKLLSYPDKIFTRMQLLDEINFGDATKSPRMIDVYFVKLREKTEKCDGFTIETVRGLGYKAVLKK